MKTGDIVMIFGNPVKFENPIGQTKLIQRATEVRSLEEWWVEYLDDPGKQYIALIKKISDGKDS
jgi:hypothetical protein